MSPRKLDSPTSPRAPSSIAPDGTLVAGRYVLQGVQGRGGMGTVYRALDQTTGETVALKRLSKRATKRGARAETLFRREYQVLMQLAHPRIVAVYDYGVTDEGPYYTMELLDGRDMRELAPLEWQQACGLLRDVASSLAILHSRRLVHRDVSPRNVRCTDAGQAKLMDFGAMTTMGMPNDVVGTPPFTPPEALNNQPLDGRADLFALGALAYWALTGRHAFPARTLRELMDLWRSRPRPPSSFDERIPAQLDALVLSLLSLDPLARPLNAAEVIERLTAIADLPAADSEKVAKAYLTTPTLVSRQDASIRFRNRMLRVLQGHGTALMVVSESGMGRSRLLSSYMLDAKLLGAMVLRADPLRAPRTEYGFIQNLAADLLQGAPEQALEAARSEAGLLLHALPALGEQLQDVEPTSFEDASQRRPRVQEALRRWFLRIAEKRPLMIAVDDVHCCDEPSAALLAALAHGRHSLMITTTRDRDAAAVASSAMELLTGASEQVELQRLDAPDIRSLLQSVFGDVPRLDLVAGWIHEHAQGSPRTCLDLAQHLVDHRLARYEGGAWTLPRNLDALDLPKSLEQALSARITNLGDDARRLAESLSLVTDYAPLSLADYAGLFPDTDDAERRVFGALGELVANQMLVGNQARYRFTQRGLVDALDRSLPEARRKLLHERLAGIYAQSYPHDLMTIAHHRRLAGDDEGMLQALVEYRPSRERLEHAPHRVHSLVIPCFEAGLDACDRLGRPPVDRLKLLRSLLAFAAVYDPALVRYAPETLARLKQDAGLIYWDELDDDLEPAERVKRCLDRAQETYERTPEAERGLDPLKAVKCLALAVTHISSACGGTFDFELIRRLPPLVEPLRSLSPALDILWRTTIAAVRRGLGQQNPIIPDTIERLQQPISGLPSSASRSTSRVLAFVLASEDAVDAPQSARQRADWLEEDPTFAAPAWHIRMLVHLYAGESEPAKACRERRDIVAMQESGRTLQLLTGLPGEARAHARCGDLMQLKAVIDPIARQARRYDGWKPVLHCVQGDYHRLRGDLAHALAEYETALPLAQPGRHSQWPTIIAGYLEALLDEGRANEARKLALQALEDCETHEIKASCVRDLQMLLSLAEAKLGLAEGAATRLETAIAAAEEAGTSRVILGRLYEARARVAMGNGDDEAFKRFASLAGVQYKTGGHPSLVAKYNALLEEAGHEIAKGSLPAGCDLDEGRTTSVSFHSTSLQVRSRLEQCRDGDERAQRALTWLCEEMGSSDGYLYLMRPGGLRLAATHGRPAPPPGLDDEVGLYLSTQQRRDGDITLTDEDEEPTSTHTWTTRHGELYRAVPLSSPHRGRVVLSGVAVLRSRHDDGPSPAWESVRTISEELLSAGDVVPAATPPEPSLA